MDAVAKALLPKIKMPEALPEPEGSRGGLVVPAPGLFAEGLRAGLPTAAADGALLQWGVSGGSAPVEAVEGTATLSPVPKRQAEAAEPERRTDLPTPVGPMKTKLTAQPASLSS